MIPSERNECQLMMKSELFANWGLVMQTYHCFGMKDLFLFFCDPGKLGGATCFKTPGGHSSAHMTH